MEKQVVTPAQSARGFSGWFYSPAETPPCLEANLSMCLSVSAFVCVEFSADLAESQTKSQKESIWTHT